MPFKPFKKGPKESSEPKKEPKMNPFAKKKAGGAEAKIPGFKHGGKMGKY